jgi:hypothetical protein
LALHLALLEFADHLPVPRDHWRPPRGSVAKTVLDESKVKPEKAWWAPLALIPHNRLLVATRAAAASYRLRRIRHETAPTLCPHYDLRPTNLRRKTWVRMIACRDQYDEAISRRKRHWCIFKSAVPTSTTSLSGQLSDVPPSSINMHRI